MPWVPTDFSYADFWFWCTLLSSGAGICFYLAFRNLLRARLVEDTPSAKIRSAPQGYVELSGQADYLDEQPLLAPLTRTPCCWYRYRIEKKARRGWRTLDSAASERLFTLRDETGACLVNPRAAEISGTETTLWNGTTRPEVLSQPPPNTEPTESIFAGALRLTLGGRYRYREERIHAGSRIYALGWFRSLGESDWKRTEQLHARELLRAWKHDTQALRARFDRNRDGLIDSGEWELARRSAYRTAHREVARRKGTAVPHSLGHRGPTRLPFLLSSSSQRALSMRYRWIAATALGGFFVLGSLTVYLVTEHLAA